MPKKLTQLTAYTTPPLVTDLLGITHDPAGTPVSRKVDFATLLNDYGHNIRAYGAVGDAGSFDAAGTDDTTAFNNAIAAAVVSTAGSGVVVIPGGRTYRISSTIMVPNNVHLVGGVGNGQDTGTPPRIVWGGAQDGVMFDVALPSNNITNVVFENLMIMGRIDGTNRPANLLKFRGLSAQVGSPDTGTYLNNIWFFGCRSHALTFGFGTTNFYMNGCRWDACGEASGGYGIYVDQGGGFFLYVGGHSTYTSVGGAGGFIFLDAENKTTGFPFAVVQIDQFKIEVFDDLLQSYSGGANPYDRRGLFRLGTNGTDLGNITHTISCDNLIVEDNSPASYCIFQITATGGTDTVNARMANLNITGGTGISAGTTDANATGQVRIVGGRIPASERPPITGSSRLGRFQWGNGLLTTGETIHSWTRNMANFIDYPVIGPVTTVANLEATRARDGMRAFVTDANATTFASDVVGGGSNHVPVYYNAGTASWKIG